MTPARLDALRREMARRVPSAQALLVAGGENRRYLSGFRGDTGLLWVGPTDAALLTDGRFWEQAGREAPSWRLVRVGTSDAGEYVDAIARTCAEAGVRVLAFEPEHTSYAVYRGWRRRLTGIRLRPVSGLVDRLRLCKEPAEVAAIRRAQAVVDRVYADWLPLLRPGAVESDLAAELEYRLRRAGAEGVAFPPIVAGGPRGAMAHAIAGPDALAAGDVVVVDVGARVDGYCSDMTRTVAVPGAPPPPGAREVWDLVRRAMDAGVAAARPGARAVDIDAAAREVVEAAGHDIPHSVGHGVGLAVHEAPRLSPRSDPKQAVPAGAVVTIEPAIYLPGRFGVRLEQLVHLGVDGSEVLSRARLGL